MVWYWDSYVDDNNLYRVFTPARRFASMVAWNQYKWAATDVAVSSHHVLPVAKGWCQVGAAMHQPSGEGTAVLWLHVTSPCASFHRPVLQCT